MAKHKEQIHGQDNSNPEGQANDGIDQFLDLLARQIAREHLKRSAESTTPQQIKEKSSRRRN